MNRLVVLLSATFLFSNCATEPQTVPTTSSLPNIIHIFADDLGYGDIGCFGALDIKTPNIDRLAAEGIKFTSFYSAAPVCSPSRAALLTGKLPQRMGINSVFFPESFTGMPNEAVTIAEMLKEKKYASGIVGKWHLGHLNQYLPLQQGFDKYYGIPYSNDMESVVYMQGNEVDSFMVNQQYITQTYTNKAIQFIAENKEHPFFLYVAHNMPHVPIYASENFLGTSNRGLYGDVIQELDWSVGQLLNALEANGLLDNTLVIFSSDNGPWLVMEDHAGSSGGLREGKHYTFEGGMVVPTVAMWKNKIPEGTIYNQVASQMDWFPTFASIAGIDYDEKEIDGKDISNVLFNQGPRESDEYLYFDGDQLQGYRSGDWKIKIPFEGFKGARWKNAVEAHDTLLINLKEDPGETTNLHVRNSALTDSLFNKMEKANQELGAFPPSLLVRGAADQYHFDYLENKKRDEKP